MRKGYFLNFSEWIEKNTSLINQNRFKFLNIDYEFKGDWNDLSNGKLWSYNLNYMDYLCQSNISRETGLYWLKLFINDLKVNNIAKEPFTIAIRSINWIKFQSKFHGLIENTDNDLINGSLYAQYRILLKNLEKHLLGNHLLEDGFSLLFGGFYFKDSLFYKTGKKIIEEELAEQILQDGGHFELSPMYHQLILDHLLDCINLVKNNVHFFDNQLDLLTTMEYYAGKMVSWLEKITFINGEIPLINDSSCNVAPRSIQLFDYAERLKVRKEEVILSDSGYRKILGNNYECLVDIGNIGPDYIPGHAHADTFNIVLNINNLPFIVDTGISTYDKNENRQIERGTISHNTVSIEGTNSSDVWAGFRVGRRARVTIELETPDKIIAMHDGFCPLKAKHIRHFIFEPGSILIKDMISGDFTGRSFLHFHPDRKIEKLNNKIIVDSCIIELSGFKNSFLMPFDYYPEFNKKNLSYKFEGEFTGSSSIKIKVNES